MKKLLNDWLLCLLKCAEMSRAVLSPAEMSRAVLSLAEMSRAETSCAQQSPAEPSVKKIKNSMSQNDVGCRVVG